MTSIDTSLIPPVSDQELMRLGLCHRMGAEYYPPHYVRYLWFKWIVIFLISVQLCGIAAFISLNLERTAYHESITAYENRIGDSLKVVKWRGRK